jgi:hypothetical protein
MLRYYILLCYEQRVKIRFKNTPAESGEIAEILCVFSQYLQAN